MKIKVFLIIILATLFFTQFNFYSKTYLSITTDDRVSEYQLTLKDFQQNSSTFSQPLLADYPFFYIFDKNYMPSYQFILGYFTAYFPLETNTLFQTVEFKIRSKNQNSYIKNICFHNSFKEKCWNAQEILQNFNISSPVQLSNHELVFNQQETIFQYKNNFENLHQEFLIQNYLKKFLFFCLFIFLGYIYYQRQRVFSFLFQNNPQIIFLWLGSIFGILTCFINPPFQVPDEIYHLSHAFYLTQSSESKSFPTNGIISAAEIHLHYRYSSHFPEEKLHYLSQLPLHLQNTLPTIYTQHYSMFPYFPSAIGVYVGKIFELSWLDITYLARITNLLSWLLLGYLAIRFIPIGKWLSCLIALSPMSIFQAASISIDSLTNGLSFLLIALIFKFIFKQQLIVLISILMVSIFLAFTKIPYLILLSLLVLFFTQRQLKWSYVLNSILIAAIIFSGFLWVFFNQMSANFNSIAFQQVHNIIQQPIEYIQLVVETIRLYGLSWIKEWVGIFGWLEIHLPMWFIILHIIMLSLYAITDSSILILNKLSKVLIFIAFILGIFIIFTTLYIIETPLLKLSYIDGIQGRYFIPLGILPFLLLQNKRFLFSNNTFSILSMIYIPFSLIFMLIFIYQYYP